LRNKATLQYAFLKLFSIDWNEDKFFKFCKEQEKAKHIRDHKDERSTILKERIS
jgi:hypothetical protein